MANDIVVNNDIYVRDWMAECPYVQDRFARKNGVKLLEYGIYPSAVQPYYRENVLGELILEELQEAQFILTAQMQYLDGNAERYSFYNNVIDWIAEQNAIKHFPRLNEGIVRSVSAQRSQYVSEPNKTMERNEIQIRFIYRRNKE